MTVELIKQAIRELPELERENLAAWLETEYRLGSSDELEALVAVGLSQLDRGEAIPGDISRARLQEKKAAWMTQQRRLAR
jgi:hypothetical protein